MPGIVDATWMRRAACGVFPELPWTTDAVGVSPWDAVTMRAICQGCPVRPACLALAEAAAPVCGGWWAGTDRDPAAAPVPVPSWVPVGADVSQRTLPLDLGTDRGTSSGGAAT